jgi:hypothetical protein
VRRFLMKTTTRRAWGAVATVVLILSGCVGGDAVPDQSATSTERAPTAEQLAGMLVTSADLAGEWATNPWGEPPTDRSSLAFGAGPFMCDDVPQQSKAAVDALRWQAIRQLEWSTEGLHIREVLRADEPTATQALFADLKVGLEACMGSTDTDENGRTWAWEHMDVPDAGDEHIGALITIQEVGADVTYLGRVTLVRDGPVLMYARIGETLFGDGTEPGFGDDQVEQAIRTMAGKIG